MASDKSKTTQDPRDIYYVCGECGRTAISFDKPFPETCAECRATALLREIVDGKA